MKKILIIEDNDDNLYLVKYILEQNGHEVAVAVSGYHGFELARDMDPDLILMDIQLPDINGMEVTKMIRASSDHPDVPIIAITSYAMTGDRHKALEAGCTDYIKNQLILRPLWMW